MTLRPTWRRALAYGLPAVALGVLVAVILSRREAFATAVDAAPLWLLGCAIALQLLALLSRCEAWRICVRADGSPLSRRAVFRAGALGGLVGILNGQAGVAARIAALRRSAPDNGPRVGTLLAAELPIV